MLPSTTSTSPRCSLQSLLTVWTLAATLAAASSPAALAYDKPAFRPLFNGKNLKGWRPVNTAPSTWSVKDGLLICSGKPIGELRTERMFQNFVLELEWRHLVPRGNAGVFVWADAITARGVPFHRGIEVQVLENAYGNTRRYTTHGDIFPIHGARMKPINGRGGSRAFPTEQRSRPSPQWNHYRITCIDGEISLAVNGKVVTRGTDCTPRKGYICLESEGGVVHYRNLRIKELPSGKLAAGQTAIADRGYQSLYTGVDLSGWVTQGKDWKVQDWILACRPAADAGSSALSTKRRFGDYGFIVDVKLAKGGSAFVDLRGSKEGRIVIGSNGSQVASALAPSGRWNRLEGTLKGGLLTLDVNGKRVLTDQEMSGPATGPLRLSGRGKVDFANLFVRDLP